VGEGEDEPGVFGDDVGGEEVDFVEGVGDGASVDAAVGVDTVESALQLGGGFDLDADEARVEGELGGGEKRVPFGRLRAGSPLRSRSLRFGRTDRVSWWLELRGLAHLCTTTTEAAPPFAVFEGWLPRTMVSGDFSNVNSSS